MVQKINNKPDLFKGIYTDGYPVHGHNSGYLQYKHGCFDGKLMEEGILEAIYYGDLSTVQEWSKNKIGIDHMTLNGYMIHLACEYNNVEIVEELLKTFDIEIQDIYGRTPLMIAAKNNNVNVVKYLLDVGANINHIDLMGYTFKDLKV